MKLRDACFRYLITIWLAGKYFHPQRDDGKEVYVFCHDFQNGGCTRIGCRFIHCSAEDEEYYNKTGELLPHVHDAYRRIMETLDECGPVCKDYFKGDPIAANLFIIFFSNFTTFSNNRKM